MATAEDDVAAAVVQRWTAQGLDALVPGSLFEDIPPEPAPGTTYAVLTVEQGPDDDELEARAFPGQVYVAHHRVTLRVYGTRPAVSAALAGVVGAFELQLLTIANSIHLGGCYPLNDRDTRREPRKQRGTDIWLGRRDYQVIHQRQIGDT